MTTALTLSDLGEQYLNNAEEVDKKIKNYNILLNDAIRQVRPDEIIRLRRMLRLYYEERAELRYTGRLLKHYYEKD